MRSTIQIRQGRALQQAAARKAGALASAAVHIVWGLAHGRALRGFVAP